ncbi:hypothetical protein M0811_07708 [Anaeramoeba ignava]|uniref:Uncharacterized protein n=1 Tax=Anaeramoeba ignava TaxID=1746090 RepID=A0A9Q0LMA2_ANAIG|nr:hypothetical protein M0811_07708 [Anaeramoeba ignava]
MDYYTHSNQNFKNLLKEAEIYLTASLQNQQQERIDDAVVYLSKTHRILLHLAKIFDLEEGRKWRNKLQNLLEKSNQENPNDSLFSVSQTDYDEFKRFLVGLSQFGVNDLSKVSEFMGITQQKAKEFLLDYIFLLKQQGKIREACVIAIKANLISENFFFDEKEKEKEKEKENEIEEEIEIEIEEEIEKKN